MRMSLRSNGESSNAAQLVRFRSRKNQSVPAQTPFQPAEQAVGHPAKVPFFFVFMVHVLRNTVREDMLLTDLQNAVVLHQPSDVMGRVAPRHWAAGLRL